VPESKSATRWFFLQISPSPPPDRRFMQWKFRMTGPATDSRNITAPRKGRGLCTKPATIHLDVVPSSTAGIHSLAYWIFERRSVRCSDPQPLFLTYRGGNISDTQEEGEGRTESTKYGHWGDRTRVGDIHLGACSSLADSLNLPSCFRILKPLTMNAGSSRTCSVLFFLIVIIIVCHIQSSFQTKVQ